MSTEAEELLSAALALPAEARAALAGQLLESLDDAATDDEVEAAWTAEIRRRLDDVDAGRVRPVPWDQAFARLRAAAGGADEG
jgi:putative addiction module component (TIGR02574 family)